LAVDFSSKGGRMTSEFIHSHFRYTDASSYHDLTKGDSPMATRQEINDALEEMGESTLLMDGFEDAFIGFSQRINEPILAVYSYEWMVNVLIFRDGMTYDDAAEYIDFNCVGAWVGEKTPIIVMPIHQV